MIHVENLTKSFRDLRRGQVLAVDHVSFDASRAKSSACWVPTGAGKTTTMRISAPSQADRGVATLAGFDVVTQATQVRQNIGFLSASTHLRPHERVGNGRILRHSLRPDAAAAARTNGDGLHHLANE